jgi:hypothetical protein
VYRRRAREGDGIELLPCDRLDEALDPRIGGIRARPAVGRNGEYPVAGSA